VELTIRLDGRKELSSQLIASVLSGRWCPMLLPWPSTTTGTRANTSVQVFKAAFTGDSFIAIELEILSKRVA
jgi:uncharacterized lipoprotein YmbA